jgi:hypothetical protein
LYHRILSFRKRQESRRAVVPRLQIIFCPSDEYSCLLQPSRAFRLRMVNHADAAGSQAAGKKQSRPSKDDLLYLVRVTGFEPAAS